MKKIIVIAVIWMGIADVFGQSADSLLIAGQKTGFYSRILQENREFWIHLPADYKVNGDKTYPVIYLLDGEQNFEAIVGIRSFLDRGPRAHFPEVIIIGIINSDRTRDLTPSSAVSLKGHATKENSGGGERFVQFLHEELTPYIENNYRASDRRVLVGHSFGGLLAMYTLLHHPAFFSDYLSLDPSFWWDDEKLLKSADSLLSELQLDGVKLYLARAGKNTHPVSQQASEDARKSQLDFKEILTSHEECSLQWDFESFENETHGTVFLIGTFYGLKYLLGEG